MKSVLLIQDDDHDTKPLIFGYMDYFSLPLTLIFCFLLRLANATCQKISCPKEDVQRDIRGNIYSVRRHCVYDNNNKPRCISCTCKESFPGSVKPSSELCGTDNMTYPSYCALKEKMCSGNTFLDIQYRGRCRGNNKYWAYVTGRQKD